MCETYIETDIFCHVDYIMAVTDNFDLDEIGFRETNFYLQCSNTYAFNRITTDVREVASKCF